MIGTKAVRNAPAPPYGVPVLLTFLGFPATLLHGRTRPTFWSIAATFIPVTISETVPGRSNTEVVDGCHPCDSGGGPHLSESEGEVVWLCLKWIRNAPGKYR